MTSQKRSEASRRNGQKGQGPKSEEGRRRSSQNSRVHGLSLPISADPELSARAERLAQLIAGPEAGLEVLHEARVIAEAQMELQRVRRLRLERQAHPSLVGKSTPIKVPLGIIQLLEATIPYMEDPIEVVDRPFDTLLPDKEPPLEDKIGDVIRSFHKLDRYERRALSKRKFAMRELSQLNPPQQKSNIL